MLVVRLWVVRSSGFLVGSFITKIIIWTIRILISRGILREDPRLASAIASVFFSLVTWINLKFFNSEVRVLSI